MTANTKTKFIDRQSIVHILIGILVLGSIWGLLEATLGGFLNLIIFPNKGAIMAGIGMVIMGMALSIYKKPSMLPSIGIVAASFKWLNSWLLFVPPNAVQIINPAMAIVLESLAFGAVAAFLMDRIAKNALVGIGAGVLSGLVSATAYVYFAIYVTHSNLLGRVITTPQAFISNQGIVQAAFLGLLLPLGYALGEKLAPKTLPVFAHRTLYYATSSAIICLCWGISAIAVASGL